MLPAVTVFPKNIKNIQFTTAAIFCIIRKMRNYTLKLGFIVLLQTANHVVIPSEVEGSSHRISAKQVANT